MAATSRDQSPAQTATASHITAPALVSTPRTRPFSVRMPVTRTSSNSRAPSLRAALTSAAETSEGPTRPSPGDQTAPSTSPAFISGQRSFASPGLIDAASTPKARASASWRRIWTSRSGVVAMDSEPVPIQPALWPVSRSSRE